MSDSRLKKVGRRSEDFIAAGSQIRFEELLERVRWIAKSTRDIDTHQSLTHIIQEFERKNSAAKKVQKNPKKC